MTLSRSYSLGSGDLTGMAQTPFSGPKLASVGGTVDNFKTSTVMVTGLEIDCTSCEEVLLSFDSDIYITDSTAANQSAADTRLGSDSTRAILQGPTQIVLAANKMADANKSYWVKSVPGTGIVSQAKIHL